MEYNPDFGSQYEVYMLTIMKPTCCIHVLHLLYTEREISVGNFLLI